MDTKSGMELKAMNEDLGLSGGISGNTEREADLTHDAAFRLCSVQSPGKKYWK